MTELSILMKLTEFRKEPVYEVAIALKQKKGDR
jgi:hypothetical protein